MLEVQRAGWRRLDPPDAAAEFRHVGPDAGIGEYPDAKGERNRADVITSLQRHAKRDGGEVCIGELPVQASEARVRDSRDSRGCLRAGSPSGEPACRGTPRAAPLAGGPPSGKLADRWQQPERLAVPQHPRGHVQTSGRLRDAHDR